METIPKTLCARVKTLQSNVTKCKVSCASCVIFLATLVFLSFLIRLKSCMNAVGLVLRSKMQLGSTCHLEGYLLFTNKFDFPRNLFNNCKKIVGEIQQLCYAITYTNVIIFYFLVEHGKSSSVR